MSGKLGFFILFSFLLGILLISTAFSPCILYGESPENFNAQVNNSAAYICVPFHYQSKSYYCGPAALEMVFDYYGEDVPQAEIADVARTYPSVTYTDELTRAAHFSNLSTSLGDEMPGNITGYSARKVGYAAFEQCGLTIDDLKTLIDKGEPVIVLMWWTPSKIYGHYRVVIGYNETHIIMHDPQYANKSMTYQTFLDFWECSGNWGLWVRPWNIELQMPGTVNKEESFEVIANITYPCSTPFDTGEYSASYCKATIKLQEGLELALGETAQHSFGNITAGNSVQTSWSIHANETSFRNISVTVTGIVEGNVGYNEKYYNYEDAIGGSCTNLLSITNETYRVHNIHTGLNYTTIQTAIDAPETLDGHTIRVDAGTYHENVIVNKSLSLVGENKNNTFIDGYSAGNVIEVTTNNVNITGFTIQESGTIYPNCCGIYLWKSSNSTISGTNITNNWYGLWFSFSSNTTISGNDLRNNTYGIRLSGAFNNSICRNQITANKANGIWSEVSCDNIIDENRIEENDYNGIELESQSSNNSISGNHIANNNNVGIEIGEDSSNNYIDRNNVTGNEYGVFLGLCSDNKISGNKLATNKQYGIGLSHCSNNTVSENMITDNSYGIQVFRAHNNKFYHNNFINNTQQVFILASDYANSWDYGYPSGGNYWSNYTGIDFDHDGIGDTEHVIDANNTDRYPLMGMFSLYNTSLDHCVNVISNSTIEHFESNSTIKMYVSGEEGLGFCRVNIPHVLMNVSSISVVIDDGLTPVLYHNYTLYDNGTHRWIYFAYEHTTHKVDIIPEFPSFLILPISMLATLLAAVLYRRKHSISRGC